jgi:MFS superfamily sulfate permease-like transporter/carbonic anhydrase
MFRSLKQDIPAGLVVFLVALPLCLGIALASGAPLISGIISGVVGGTLVVVISGSHTSVSGPAAGLTAVVLAGITQLGSFEVFLSALALAGVIQFLFGIFRLGFIADYIPSNVIKGLLSAIGIILILKQIPHAFGYDAVPEGDFSFMQQDGKDTFSELLNMLNYVSPGAVTLSVLSLGLLIIWDRTPMRKWNLLPAPLFVVVFGVLLNQFFMMYAAEFAIVKQEHLVRIPEIRAGDLLHIPHLQDFQNTMVWMVALTLAIVASIETLLNVEAVDRIDPHKRETPTNRELMGQGAGNLVSGLLGGIPITSVIVRSSVNISAGSRTKMSAIVHGLFLVLSVLFLSNLINLIPLSALSAVLIYTGYKLARVSIFTEMYRKGWDQFAPFVITILAIIFTNLLKGVMVGTVASLFFILRSNFRNPFVRDTQVMHIGEVIRLELPNQVSFLNRASIKRTLWGITAGSKVVIDATSCDYVDQDVLELIRDFADTYAPKQNIQVNLLGLERHGDRTDLLQFHEVLDVETRSHLTPERVLELMNIGNERFLKGRDYGKRHQAQLIQTAGGQAPMAVIVSCIDSRASPEVTFDANLGDYLAIRNAGNVMTADALGSIEVAVKHLGVKLIVVKSHADCGAVKLAMLGEKSGNIHYVTDQISVAIQACGCAVPDSNVKDSALVNRVARQNAQLSIERMLQGSTYLKEMLEAGRIGIVCAFHDISTGKVYFEPLLKA